MAVDLSANLKVIYNSYLKCANKIKDWDKLSRTDLANKYLEYRNTNKNLADAYFCALTCSYFYMVTYFYTQSRSISNDITDFVEWVIEALLYAFKYCAWLNPNSKCYGNADKAFSTCLKTIRLLHFKHSNQLKRNGDYGNKKLSFDELLENFDDSTYNLGEDDDEYHRISGSSACKSLIQYYIDKKDLRKAIILDLVAFNDNIFLNNIRPTTYDTKYVFSQKRLVTALLNTDSFYEQYFANNYNINQQTITEFITDFKKCNRTKLNQIVKQTLDDIKLNDSELVKEYLC